MAFTGAGNFALFTDQVDETVVRAMQPLIIYDKVSRKVGVSKGNVREYNQMTADEPITMSKVSEGGEFLNATVEFDRKVVAFDETGTAITISKRLIEDAEWDVVQYHMEEAGFAAARTINRDCLESIRANVPTSLPDNSTPAVAAWSAAGADPIRDISLLVERLESNNYGQGTKYLVIHPTPGAYLRIDPNVSRALNYGDATVLKGDKMPQLFDVNILRTSDLKSQTGYTSLANTMALLVNADYAMNYYERQPLTVEQENIPKTRSIQIIPYMRYGFAVIRPNATAQLTGM